MLSDKISQPSRASTHAHTHTLNFSVIFQDNTNAIKSRLFRTNPTNPRLFVGATRFGNSFHPYSPDYSPRDKKCEQDSREKSSPLYLLFLLPIFCFGHRFATLIKTPSVTEFLGRFIKAVRFGLNFCGICHSADSVLISIASGTMSRRSRTPKGAAWTPRDFMLADGGTEKRNGEWS